MAPQVYLEDFVVCCPPEEWLVDAHRVQEMYVGENRWQVRTWTKTPPRMPLLLPLVTKPWTRPMLNRRQV
jgi:hypothetical protein